MARVRGLAPLPGDRRLSAGAHLTRPPMACRSSGAGEAVRLAPVGQCNGDRLVAIEIASTPLSPRDVGLSFLCGGPLRHRSES